MTKNTNTTANRRRILALTGAAAIGSVSGCTSLMEVATEEQIERRAEPAEADEQVVRETGFEEVRSETVVIEEEFEAAGQRREFVAESEVRVYRNRIESEVIRQEESLVAIVSTPGETVAGQQLSPLANMSEEEVIEHAQETAEQEFSGQIRDPRKVDDMTQNIFGDSVDVSVYEITVISDDVEETGYLHFALAERGEDVVLLAGVYPEESTDEREKVVELFESV